ncbi:MAG: hypothetical protein R2789_17560 [Microthrixaceae bacterium]
MAVPIAAGAILAVLSIVGLYFFKVTRRLSQGAGLSLAPAR